MNPIPRLSIRWTPLAAAALMLLAGCASYHLGSAIPPEKRSIAVPVFVNGSGQPEVEVLATQAVLSEFRRDGTLRVADREEAALELVGRITSCAIAPMRHDRDHPYLSVEYRMVLTARIQLIERATGRVVANLESVTGDDIFRTQSDLPSTKRDALPRASARLARNIVRETLAAW
jgi:TolB-like protein